MKKHSTCILSIILILSLLPINVFAAPKVKTGTITGSVSEAQLRLPLPLEGVTVSVEGTNKSVQTNRLGRYTLTKVAEGEVELVFSKEGYEEIRKTVSVRANRINNIYTVMDKNSSPMVKIEGQVKTKYEVKDVLATIIRIYPDSVPMILDLIIPAEYDFLIPLLLKLDAEKVIDAIPNNILDSVLKNFNPQDLLNLIPDLPDEIRQLLLKIIPGSITNEMPLPGTHITVRDGNRVIKVTVADKNGSYQLNIPENCDVEYLLYGFEAKSLNALEISDTTYLLPAAGTVRGTVTGENNEPLEGTVVTVVSAEGKPSGITDEQGKYVITGVKRLLPGFGGGFGGHTLSFDKEDYITAKATALFAFGISLTDKKLELAPPFGDLDVLVKQKNYTDWITRGAITVKIFDFDNKEIVPSKKLTSSDVDISSGIAKYSLSNLPIGMYRIEFKDNPRWGTPRTLVIENVEIKRGKTTTVEATLGGTASITTLNAPMPIGDEPEFEELEPIEETTSLPEADTESDGVENPDPVVPDTDAEIEEDPLPLGEQENEDLPPVDDSMDPEFEAENN